MCRKARPPPVCRILFKVGDLFESTCQLSPEAFYRGDKHAFAGRVHTLKGRAERNHVEMRILFEEKTTLKTGLP